MCLQNPSPELLESEKQVQLDINSSIDNFENLIFNAGAGAGKTHALIESLKYLIQKHGDRLKTHNQNIICITYTNVATNEIKERLGNSELVKVSTIHERLWELIEPYQKHLVEIHKENIEALLVQLRNKLYSDSIEKDYKEFRDLDDGNKSSFITMIKTKKSDFYTYINKSVVDLRSNFADITTIFPNILKSKERFTKIVKLIFKIENFKECLNKIEEATDKKFKSVNYLSRYNNDILHKMIISHDTLLDYALRIIEKYTILQQILVNKYPYILVDEYQDTHPSVVKILKILADYAHVNENKFFVAYFGDTAQNIYEDGVGNNINVLHPHLKKIDKIHNRRSTNEIIEVINNIRNDDIEQQSIYEDSQCGSVKFYQGSFDSIDNFIIKYKQEWNINQNNKLHCLVLTNKLVAKYNKFENFYSILSSTNYYKKNWKSITAELLNFDIKKLGSVANLLYRVLKFKFDLKNLKTPLTTIINQDMYKDLNLDDIDKLLQLLKSINGSNLQRYFISMFKIYNQTDNENYKKIIKNLINIELEISCDGLLTYLLDELYRDVEENKLVEAKENIRQLLTIDFLEYEKWFNFINKEENEEVIYHTYHGTKGEEYENVIIIMENQFGLDKTKFSDFFANSVELSKKEIYIKTKNLLYVACSRAIKNLRVFYLDDVTDFKVGIENIFDEVLEFDLTTP
ncbi:UvrD-helicase domain-containing protein [Aliarcobacter butzleri]|uniref:UvrD-helicase domain-containing protein n=2 Tax=Aliarcobacter butzleri TaxID=28197 RepID=UPI001EDB2B48|nr:UvrD-helicase domain-containing protein [Aliarcobacter butzleri]MCG3667379.1 UvrD-helicase domain-containing protein [Aliarcobacter butzleri]MCT7606927.1 UvrD-helicase domain-containing protein [Aliarcobacter butzleri]MCT7609091.1 UvrD-helicase domain-containing protein [Aliarcobacter butzleri]